MKPPPRLPVVVEVPGPDLPPKWDGRSVQWRGWTQSTAFLCHRGRRKARKDICSECGSTARPEVNLGVLHPAEGAMISIDVPQRAPSGRTYFKPVLKPAWPIVDLVAFRCPGCTTDSVWQMSTDHYWVLDPDDYSPEGSRP